MIYLLLADKVYKHSIVSRLKMLRQPYDEFIVTNSKNDVVELLAPLTARDSP